MGEGMWRVCGFCVWWGGGWKRRRKRRQKGKMCKNELERYDNSKKKRNKQTNNTTQPINEPHVENSFHFTLFLLFFMCLPPMPFLRVVQLQ